MRGLCLIFSIFLFIGVVNSLPLPFLWPSFGSSTTTTTTTTHGHAGPPHPHVHGHSAGITTVIGQPHSSHLHIRPTHVGSYLANRPLPPLVMGANHHHHLRPLIGPNTHLHMHGGIAGTGHQHHYHRQHNHHHHPHVSRSLRFTNAHSAVHA